MNVLPFVLVGGIVAYVIVKHKSGSSSRVEYVAPSAPQKSVRFEKLYQPKEEPNGLYSELTPQKSKYDLYLEKSKHMLNNAVEYNLKTKPEMEGFVEKAGTAEKFSGVMQVRDGCLPGWLEDGAECTSPAKPNPNAGELGIPTMLKQERMAKMKDGCPVGYEIVDSTCFGPKKAVAGPGPILQDCEAGFEAAGMQCRREKGSMIESIPRTMDTPVLDGDFWVYKNGKRVPAYVPGDIIPRV